MPVEKEHHTPRVGFYWNMWPFYWYFGPVERTILNIGIIPLYLATLPLQFAWNLIPNIIEIILFLTPIVTFIVWAWTTAVTIVGLTAFAIYMLFLGTLVIIPVMLIIFAIIAVIVFIIGSIFGIIVSSFGGIFGILAYYAFVAAFFISVAIMLTLFIIFSFTAYIIIGFMVVAITVVLALFISMPVTLGLIFMGYYQLALLFQSAMASVVIPWV